MTRRHGLNAGKLKLSAYVQLDLRRTLTRSATTHHCGHQLDRFERKRPRVMNNRSAPNGENRLLAALQPADFSLLKPYLKQIVLEQGVLLHEQEHSVEQAYFPQSGMISLLTVMGDGQAIETATVGREGTVGAMSGLGPAHASSRAVVQVAGTAWVITTSRLQAAVRQSEHLRNIILQYKETLLGQVQQTAGCNALHKAEARLARWLLQTRDRVDSDRIPLTQDFLSQMLGVRRTTVTMVAGVLQEAGLIRYRRGHIEIVDRPGLEEAACECYSVIRKRTDQALPKADV
jgi:CRP-like cAMP-binding protein